MRRIDIADFPFPVAGAKMVASLNAALLYHASLSIPCRTSVFPQRNMSVEGRKIDSHLSFERNRPKANAATLGSNSAPISSCAFSTSFPTEQQYRDAFQTTLSRRFDLARNCRRGN